MPRLAISAAILAALAAPACAEGPLAPGEVFSFDGPRWGGHVGYGRADFETPTIPPEAFTFFPAEAAALQAEFDGIEAFDPSGLTYGFHAGYDVQRGSFVVGGEVAAFGGSLDDEDAEAFGGTTDEIAQFRLDYVARAMMRGGVARERDLFFVTGGAAYLDLEDGESESGIAYGLGYERAVSSRSTLGVQVIQHEFDSLLGVDDLDVELQTIEARFSVRF
ncbi:hypothetical protein JQC91_11275 [Jannaschia sp. Os4]|uniref:outer membrane protein n=1 Tax=Jannaschia sp. Os4 TaxID=2807617 RepID=UPI00193A011A|nr:hypothetical protein [Jannaschia sp. Os4]MBM2576881.1 hypothetical protein [Jannaschia sp. Os4]